MADRQELTRAQAALVRRVAEARATVPDLTLEADVDIGPLADVLDHVLQAVASALRRHPRANGAYRDGGIERNQRVNVGIAHERGGTVLVPTIQDADSLTLEALGAARRGLARRVAGDEITSAELSGGTFTVWNAGAGDVARFAPVIVPGQAGALGVGSARAAPVVRAGRVEPGRLLSLTLVCDHRILFGQVAAAFLADVARGLSHA